MNFTIGQIFKTYNLYLVNRGIIPIPYPWIFIFDPAVSEDFINFVHIFRKYPRVAQSDFMNQEKRYAKHPNIIPANPYTEPFVEAGVLVGVKNTATGIVRTRLTGKVIVNLEARRNGKTTELIMTSVDTLRIPLGKALYSQQIYYGHQTDAKKFFHLMKNQLELDKIVATATSTDGKISRKNNIIEYLYLTAEGENRGHKPIIAYIDEMSFISNTMLDKFMKAIEPSLGDNLSNMVFLSSPAESLENTYLTDLALDPERSVSQMLPAFLNNAKTEAGNYIISSTNLIANTKDLITKNQKFMVKTTIFGIPLTYGGRELFRKLNFYIFNKKSLGGSSYSKNQALVYDPYAHIENLPLMTPEEVETQKRLSDLRREYGSPPADGFSPIRYSFLVSDLSFSGIGDYTVIMHIGMSVSGDYYVLRIFREPTVATDLEDILVDFLLECLCSPHGSHLIRLYIEGKDADATPRIRTLQNIIKDYVTEKLDPYLHIPNHITHHNGMSCPTVELKKRLSVKFGYINPSGGYFNDKKSPAELLHGNTINDALILSTSGNKLQRARTAITVLSRRSPITGEKIKIVFMCPYTEDYVVEDVLSEILSIEASDISNTNAKKKTAANAHDDAFDTLVYGILIAEKLNDSLLQGYDILNTRITAIANDGTIGDIATLQKEARRANYVKTKKLERIKKYNTKKISEQKKNIRSRPYKYS